MTMEAFERGLRERARACGLDEDKVAGLRVRIRTMAQALALVEARAARLAFDEPATVARLPADDDGRPW